MAPKIYPAWSSLPKRQAEETHTSLDQIQCELSQQISMKGVLSPDSMISQHLLSKMIRISWARFGVSQDASGRIRQQLHLPTSTEAVSVVPRDSVKVTSKSSCRNLSQSSRTQKPCGTLVCHSHIPWCSQKTDSLSKQCIDHRCLPRWNQRLKAMLKSTSTFSARSNC